MGLLDRLLIVFRSNRPQCESGSVDYPTPLDLYKRFLSRLSESGEEAWIHFNWEGYEDPWVEVAAGPGEELCLNIGTQHIDPLKHLPDNMYQHHLEITALGDGLYQIVGIAPSFLAEFLEAIMAAHKPYNAEIVVGWIES